MYVNTEKTTHKYIFKVMAESVLKKEFTQRDVQRIRNLITKKFGDKTQIQSGYGTRKITHEEGDIWEEDNKTWTIKNGIKQSVSKHDEFRKIFFMPLACPECGQRMPNTLHNKKVYIVHKKCSDCVIKMETELKRVGKYEEYERVLVNQNKNDEINDMIQFLEEWENVKETYVTEQGDIELWSTGNVKTKEYLEFKQALQKAKETDI